jgi:hypothetical protein
LEFGVSKARIADLPILSALRTEATGEVAERLKAAAC